MKTFSSSRVITICNVTTLKIGLMKISFASFIVEILVVNWNLFTFFLSFVHHLPISDFYRSRIFGDSHGDQNFGRIMLNTQSWKWWMKISNHFTKTDLPFKVKQIALIFGLTQSDWFLYVGSFCNLKIRRILKNEYIEIWRVKKNSRKARKGLQ